MAATVDYDPATKKVTLDPDGSLGLGATYTATITTGAEDPAGNPLGAREAWTFTVRR